MTKQHGGLRLGAGRPQRQEPKSKPIWCGQIDDDLRQRIINLLTPQERLAALMRAIEEKQAQ